MNANTGALYESREAALADLGPGETPADVVEVIGAPETVQSIARAVQQARAVEARRAKAKAARQSRRRNR